MSIFIPTPVGVADIDDDATRRRFLHLLGALGLLAACADDDTSNHPTPVASPTTRPVTHARGTTAVPLDPVRIVVANDFQDLDAVLAVGLVPAAFGYLPYATDDIAPWAAAALGSPRLGTESGMVDLEEVAAARPDLIVGSADFLTESYDKLSVIAPTIALDLRGDWRAPTQLMGVATGREERAAAAIAAAEGALTAARERIGAAPRVAVVNLYGGEVGLASSEDPQGVLLGELGLSVLDVGRGGVAGEISAEELGLLDEADVVLVEDFVADETATLLSSPVFAALEVVTEGRVSLLSPAVTRAAYLRSVLSTPTAADGYATALAAALAGAGTLTPRAPAPTIAPTGTATPSAPA